jgi:hypothetical protein
MEYPDRTEEFEAAPGLSRRVRRSADSVALLMVSFTVLLSVINTVHDGGAYFWVITVIIGFLTGGCVVLSFVVRRIHRHLLEAAVSSHLAVARPREPGLDQSTGYGDAETEEQPDPGTGLRAGA